MIIEKRFLDDSVSTGTTTYKVLLQVVHLSVCLTGTWEHLQLDLSALRSFDAVYNSKLMLVTIRNAHPVLALHSAQLRL